MFGTLVGAGQIKHRSRMYTHLVAVLDQRRIHLTRFRRGQTWLSPQGIRGATTNDTPFQPRGGIWFRRSDTRRQPSCQERTFRTSSTTCPRPPVPPDSPLACYQHSAQQRPPRPAPPAQHDPVVPARDDLVGIPRIHARDELFWIQGSLVFTVSVKIQPRPQSLRFFSLLVLA